MVIQMVIQMLIQIQILMIIQIQMLIQMVIQMIIQMLIQIHIEIRIEIYFQIHVQMQMAVQIKARRGAVQTRAILLVNLPSYAWTPTAASKSTFGKETPLSSRTFSSSPSTTLAFSCRVKPDVCVLSSR